MFYHNYNIKYYFIHQARRIGTGIKNRFKNPVQIIKSEHNLCLNLKKKTRLEPEPV